MCGISGIINKNNQSVIKEKIQTINDLIVHRGPDDEGFYFGANFAFGHRRLSIIDLTADGHQPMHYLNERYTITYNGEIYNYIEIRNELKKDGYVFNSNSDTEVILASYNKWGKECVNKFNGMWAFAIHDKQKNTIFCSRDRFGVKPFYYTEIDGKFIFGSEIKQLLEFYKERFVNKKLLIDYLVIGFEEHSNETFFENIYKLEQSHNLVYDLSSHIFKISKYYSINMDSSVNKLNEKESVRKYQKIFKQSIGLRLRSDVKVGTCLSGGLDSSSIAAIVGEIYNQKNTNQSLIAIHGKSSQKSSDESQYAKIVADHCGLDLKTIEPTCDDFLKNIDEVIYTQEEPFGGPSVFMQYFVMKKAKQVGCTVMLDGQGGDETLLGYERYYPAYFLSLSLPDRIKTFIQSSEHSKLSLKQMFMYFLYFTSPKIRLLRLKRKSTFIKNEFLKYASLDIIDELSKKYRDIFKLQVSEILSTQMPHLLKYEDKNSMRHSIETRLPFIDYKVLEMALSINNKHKIKYGWSKYILRKVIDKILPKSIVWRKNKLGFEAPSKTWINHIENDMKNSINESKIINTISNRQINFNDLDEIQKWKFFNVSKWEDLYNIEIKL